MKNDLPKVLVPDGKLFIQGNVILKQKNAFTKEINESDSRIIQEFDLICGGIPCQPFSVAGLQKGTEDDRHLWPSMFEIIKYKKPSYVIVENVGGFVNVALDDVCLNLEAENYATQSFIIPACGVEAPHRRDRIWIIGKRQEEI